MAEADEIAQYYAYRLAIAGLGLFAAWKFCYKYYRRLQQKIYAFIVNRVGRGHTKSQAKRKEQLFSPLHEISGTMTRPLTVLEIGAGGGANFKFLPPDTELVCVDPNPEFRGYLNEQSIRYPHINFKELVTGIAEDMHGIENDSVDAVICTLTFCSVLDVDLCAKEIKRVLKPGGQLYFMEHVRADKKSWLYLFQRITTPMWKPISEGCHFTREPWVNFEKAGFTKVDYDLFDATGAKRLTLKNVLIYPFLKLMTPHCMGVATK